jgi:Putative porin
MKGSFFILVPMSLAASANAAPDPRIGSLREELRALQAEQAKTNERIAKVEAALSEIEKSPPSSLHVAANNSSPLAVASAVATPPDTGNRRALAVSGDVRLRYESNFGDRDARSRDRGVVRARLRGSYALSSWLTAGAQLTTGDPDDPNSSDATLSNFDDDLDISLDQVWLRGRWGRFELQGGKISQPFVRTDMVWDGDVYPEGVSASFSFPAAKSLTLKTSGLYFIIDESIGGPDSRMIGGQATLFYGDTSPFGGSVSVAYYDYSLKSLAGGDLGDFRTNRFADGRYISDFNLVDVIASAEWSGLGPGWPIRITGDYVRNLGAERDHVGLSLLTAIGRTSEKGDWRFGYSYARVGTDAVLAAFSEDNTTIATNVIQHNLSIDYVVRPRLILNGTYYRFRPKNAIDAGVNDPDDWLNRVRINLVAEF